MLRQEENISFSQQVVSITPQPACPEFQSKPGARAPVPSLEPLLIIIDDYPPSQRLLAELCAHVGLQPVVCRSRQNITDLLNHEIVIGIVVDTDNHSISASDLAQVLAATAAPNKNAPLISLVSPQHYGSPCDASSLAKPICVADFFRIFEHVLVPRLEALRLICQYRLSPELPQATHALV
jgi:hypothetical protein